MLVWFVVTTQGVSATPRLIGLGTLGFFFLVGLAYARLIGTRFDRPWMKFAIYGFDMAALCALFAYLPPSSGGDVPQIIAFRAYGIYYLFLPLALSTLALSPLLVAWTGLVGTLGWWAAFLVVVRDMPETLSWGDISYSASTDHYLATFLDVRFIGAGNRIEETGFLLLSAIVLAVTVYRARHVFFAQVRADEERAYVSKTLGQYVPEAVAARLVEARGALVAKSDEATVLCLDIDGFTRIAENAEPADIIRVLNEFLADCSDIVAERQGVVISFLGDGFIAAFNTPIAVDDHATRALNAARALCEHAATVAYDGRGFKIRIGIASGLVASGSIGSSRRQAFTIYGDTVNLAARLQELNKEFGTSILLAESSAALLGANEDLQRHGPVPLRGRAQPIAVYAPDDKAPSADQS